MTQQAVGSDPVSQGLLKRLAQDEAARNAAHEKAVAAYADLDVANRIFATMRDAVRERMGISPYSKNVVWPDLPNPIAIAMRGLGCRYVRMKVGDAAAEVLEESEEPLTLDQIASMLSAGGLYIRDSRTVNAALRNTKGIKRLDDGRYTYEKQLAEAQIAIFPDVFERLGE